jgi:hypothetical protein
MQDYATRADILIPEVVNLRSDSTILSFFPRSSPNITYCKSIIFHKHTLQGNPDQQYRYIDNDQ